MTDILTPRCAECGFALAEHEPRVLTPFGWTHVLCAPDDIEGAA